MQNGLTRNTPLPRTNKPGFAFRDLAFVAIFFLMIGAQFWIWAFKIQDIVIQENRSLAEMPVIQTPKQLASFPASFDQFYKDHFVLRNLLIRQLRAVQLHVFRESVFPQVLVGKDQWLYYTGNQNIDYYQRLSLFTDDELKEIQQNLDRTYNDLAGKGITFLVVVAPNKETIYPEYLPGYIQQYGSQSRLDQILAYLDRVHAHTQILDLRQPLLEAKQQVQVYARTDTHWNSVGAYYAYQQIMLRLGDQFPGLVAHRFDEFDLAPYRQKGDLALLLAQKDEFTEQTVQLEPKFPVQAQSVAIYERRAIFIYEVPNPSLPRLLIFGDSFSRRLMPYLAEHFSRFYWRRRETVDGSLIGEEQPNIVIYELAERNLAWLLPNPPAATEGELP